jgi:hypothetical protein
MTDPVDLDLTDLSIERIEVAGAPAVALESLAAGHAMTETSASIFGAELFLCSCCCCC